MTLAGASVASEFDKLQREFDGCLAEVLGVARTAATTTRPSWIAIVESLTGQPPGVLPPAGDGANPAEVREVLLAVQALYERRLQPVERACKQQETDDDTVEDAIWTFRHRRLAHFVEDELAGYIKTVTPRPSVGSVFAKAAKLAPASVTPLAAVASSAQLHRCKTCAAPRLSDGLYGNCLYCGHPFFTGREELN